MGKAYAPALADLYLLEFDNAACNGNFADLIKLYFRFLDDVFFVFLGDVTELKNLENFLNSIIPGIKITLNYSVDFISFLTKRNYSSSFLRKMKRDIWALPDVKPATAGGEDLPIVVPYSDIGHSASRSWKNIIKDNEKFMNYRLVTAFSNSPNLRQKLVRSSIASVDANLTNGDVRAHSTNHEDSGMHFCTSKRCKASNYIIRGKTF